MNNNNVNERTWEAFSNGIAMAVRAAKGEMSIQEMNENVAHNDAIDRTIKIGEIVKGSAFENAILTARDVHEDVFGYKANIAVAHRRCIDKEDYKAAYVEAWHELVQTAREALEAEKAADKAAWEEHVKAVEACGFSGTKLEQLKKYCIQTIPEIAAHPEDYFTEDGLSLCAGTEFTLRCSTQRHTIIQWINS